MYCEQLGVSLEYDGAHHYHFTPHFHKTHAAFVQQQWLDHRKERICAEHDIHLIRIPYSVFEGVQLTDAAQVRGILREFLSQHECGLQELIVRQAGRT